MSRQNVDLKCPHCGSECRWLDDVSTKVCLHCGYQEKLVDSDTVRKAKIAADKEVKLAQIEHEKERAKQKEFLICMGGLAILLVLCFVALLSLR